MLAGAIQKKGTRLLFKSSMATRRGRSRKAHVAVEYENQAPVQSLTVTTDSGKTSPDITQTGSRGRKRGPVNSVSVTTKPEYPSSPSKGLSPVTLSSQVDVSKPGSSKPPKQLTKEAADKKIKYEPLNWKPMLENIQKMRANKDAPVDSMGCERSMEDNVEPKVRRFQTLLSLMLSSQTKDPVTFAAMERLKAGTALTVQKMLDMPEEEIGKTIIPVGFWRRKALYIKKTCQILRKDYDDDIPNSIEGLCALPGVGPKMAYIAMHVAWETNAGIGVDTHVHRISNRLKWAGPKETKTPEETRKALQSWLPQEMWQDINILLVGFGQTICLPLRPKCESCLNLELCQFGKAELRSQKSKSPKKPKTPVKSAPQPQDLEPLGTSKYFEPSNI